MDLGRDCFVSVRGLSSVLGEINDKGMPATRSRWSFYDARKRASSLETPYGKLVQSVALPTPSGDVEISVQSPSAMVYACVSQCEPYRRLLQAAVDQHGVSNPWGLIVYNDCITPTDSARSHDERKIISFYWSLRELGAKALATEEAWHVFATVREKLIGKYSGGISRFTREVMLETHFNTLMHEGMMLPRVRAGGPLRVAVWAFVSDEPALKDFFENKGHAGLKPCILCRNVLLHRMYDAALHGGFVTTACSDFNRFALHTRDSMRALLHDMAVKQTTMSAADFAELCVCAGLNLRTDGLLGSALVDVTSQIMYDWAHTYLIGGLFDTELGMCLKAMQRDGSVTTYASVGAFVERWVWPQSQEVRAKKLFTPKAVRSHWAANAFVATASQTLSLVPVIAYYFAQVQSAGDCIGVALINSLLACCDVVELIQCSRLGVVSEQTLGDAIATHVRLYTLAYSDAATVPKHHYSMHLASMLGSFGMLISCICMERLHRVVKRCAWNRRSLVSFDTGIIEDITINQIRDRSRDWISDGCLEPSAPRGRIRRMLSELYPDRNVEISNRLRVPRGIVVKGDVVLYDGGDEGLHCGEVLLIVNIDGVPYIFVRHWPRTAERVTVGRVMRCTVAADEPLVLPATMIEEVVIYSVSGGIATVLLSPLYR